MKFTIFKWWESWIKPLVYIITLLATAGLIIGYCHIKDDGGTLAFSVSISYALVLFLVAIPINKIEKYTAEKLYEREAIYLTLQRLREITNSTIQKVDKNDINSLRENVIWFQMFTGREARMLKEKLEGKKVPIVITEKGLYLLRNCNSSKISLLNYMMKEIIRRSFQNAQGNYVNDIQRSVNG